VALRCPKCGSERLRALRGSKYLCEYCGYEFYACPACGEFFERAWQLSSHMRRHRKGKKEVHALLEEVLASQRLILAKLEELSGKLDRALELQREALELLSARAPAPAPCEMPGEGLPDFLKGNPWLSILHSRGSG
jgi:predicted RNA-binding Zn-ribbon protein involved in translation (DUF1610 family)